MDPQLLVAVSPDTPMVCAARLKSQLSKMSVATLVDRVFSRQYTGRVQDAEIRVWPVGPTDVGGVPVWHLWTPVFTGSFEDALEGTRLVGRVRINRAIPAFGIFFAVVLLGWLWVGVDAALRRVQNGDAISSSLVFGGLLMPLIFGIFLGLFYAAGYWLYVRDKSELLAFLTKAMAADPVTTVDGADQR